MNIHTREENDTNGNSTSLIGPETVFETLLVMVPVDMFKTDCAE